MARTNVARVATPVRTHEGAPAKRIKPELQLRRAVMACMLWEDTFYESGVEIAARIKKLIPEVDPAKVAQMAIEAREQMKLRHVPLLITREMARAGAGYQKLVGETLARVIQRPDELTEFLAIYWKDGRQPLSAQAKKGLATAFNKFNAYNLAKYNQKDKAVTLKDVLFLTHPDPDTKEKAETWKKLINGTLEAPDTWEVNLSAGKDKKATWVRLLQEEKLGALALLRNLRNMQQVGVEDALIRQALENIKVERVLPYRFIAAARYAPHLEPYLEKGMFKAIEGKDKLPGLTVLLVDVSGSMSGTLSGKSDMNRIDAACGLAILARELCEDIKVFTFSNHCVDVPARRGFALRDAITQSQSHGGTYLGGAMEKVNKVKYDRLIVLTDEQAHDPVGDPKGRGYMINVASYQNGVGYGKWVHIDGWSEAVLDYVSVFERELEG